MNPGVASPMTNERFSPRETIYKGIKMRSRLEAGFAQELDQLIASGEITSGPTWIYEPRAYASEQGQYLPDFHFPGGDGADDTFYEIKPSSISREARVEALTRMHIIRASLPSAGLILILGTWLPEGRFEYQWYAEMCFGSPYDVCPVCTPERWERLGGRT